MGDEDQKSNMNNFQAKKLENWEEQVLHQASSASVMDVKQENSASSYAYAHANEDFQAAKPTSWSQIMPTSSPKSCVTSFSSSMLDFSTTKGDGRHPPPDRSSEVSEIEKGITFLNNLNLQIINILGFQYLFISLNFYGQI